MLLDLAGRPHFPAIEHLGQHERIVIVPIPVDDGVNSRPLGPGNARRW